MPKRIAVNCIVIHREGKKIRIKPGQSVDLTVEELADINASNRDAIRTPVNEDKSAPEADVPKVKSKGKTDAAPAADAADEI